MGQSKDEVAIARGLDWLARHWKSVALLTWLGFCGWFIFNEWNSIRYFGLGDTDDNMRIMQVRALLHGQGWFDLRQYRMNPPYGANIHWSRLVDLPIAGLILLLRPVLGGAGAERWAVGIAPLLPYLLLLFSLALTARRLIDPRAYPLAFVAAFFAGSTNGMFMPERIDHHGWQLALLALSMSGIADPKRVRVTEICPGRVATEIFAHVHGDSPDTAAHAGDRLVPAGDGCRGTLREPRPARVARP